MLTKTRIGNHLRRHMLGDQPTFRQGFKEGVAFAQKHAPASKPLMDDLTDREQLIIRFALHRFMTDAHGNLNAAAQDKENRRFKDGDVGAFAKDAKDAEALLGKLRAAEGIKES